MRWLVLLLALSCAQRAYALQVVDVTGLSEGPELRCDLLRDEGGDATLADVRGRLASHFRPQPPGEISLGFDEAPSWVRCAAENASDEPVHWLLELAYPHLDYVELYELDGERTLRRHQTGDMLPFATRDVEHPNFVFALATPAHAERMLYLRVQTSGSLRIPLRAWSPLSLMAHDGRQNLLLWMFYGAILLLAWYNLAVAGVLRRMEHAHYALLLLCIFGGIFTLSGQMGQFLLRDHVLALNRALSCFIALGALAIQLYTRRILAVKGLVAAEERFYAVVTPAAACMTLFTLLAPYGLGLRVVLLGIVLYVPCGAWLLRSAQRRQDPRLRLYLISWYCYTVAIPVSFAAHASWLPPWPIFLMAPHIASVVHGVLTSLALPARINELGADLALLNVQLSTNVSELQSALATAKLATAEAQRATKAKDEFMATMSHELRTPLNAIINVPQGLLEDFPRASAGVCERCEQRYWLDEGERLSADARCELCGGALRAVQLIRYVGDAAHTSRFLHKIERSGKHLLQMVNGVLDFSKMEAGRLELNIAQLDVQALLVDAIDEMSDLADRKGLRIALQAPAEQEPGLGDALRLKQVLLNLLSNAIKFSESGTQVTVRWRREEDHDVVSVNDQGIGISSEDRDRVFVSFEQVHKGDTRKYGGTGLGLSISRSLVRMHGGELWVESTLGAGSTFTFTLPRVASARLAG